MQPSDAVYPILLHELSCMLQYHCKNEPREHHNAPRDEMPIGTHRTQTDSNRAHSSNASTSDRITRNYTTRYNADTSSPNSSPQQLVSKPGRYNHTLLPACRLDPSTSLSRAPRLAARGRSGLPWPRRRLLEAQRTNDAGEWVVETALDRR
jgi:hypothetical protein